jgi:hypothetical protein
MRGAVRSVPSAEIRRFGPARLVPFGRPMRQYELRWDIQDTKLHKLWIQGRIAFRSSVVQEMPARGQFVWRFLERKYKQKTSFWTKNWTDFTALRVSTEEIRSAVIILNHNREALFSSQNDYFRCLPQHPATMPEPFGNTPYRSYAHLIRRYRIFAVVTRITWSLSCF